MRHDRTGQGIVSMPLAKPSEGGLAPFFCAYPSFGPAELPHVSSVGPLSVISTIDDCASWRGERRSQGGASHEECFRVPPSSAPRHRHADPYCPPQRLESCSNGASGIAGSPLQSSRGLPLSRFSGGASTSGVSQKLPSGEHEREQAGDVPLQVYGSVNAKRKGGALHLDEAISPPERQFLAYGKTWKRARVGTLLESVGEEGEERGGEKENSRDSGESRRRECDSAGGARLASDALGSPSGEEGKSQPAPHQGCRSQERESGAKGCPSDSSGRSMKRKLEDAHAPSGDRQGSEHGAASPDWHLAATPTERLEREPLRRASPLREPWRLTSRGTQSLLRAAEESVHRSGVTSAAAPSGVVDSQGVVESLEACTGKRARGADGVQPVLGDKIGGWMGPKALLDSIHGKSRAPSAVSSLTGAAESASLCGPIRLDSLKSDVHHQPTPSLPDSSCKAYDAGGKVVGAGGGTAKEELAEAYEGKGKLWGIMGGAAGAARMAGVRTMSTVSSLCHSGQASASGKEAAAGGGGAGGAAKAGPNFLSFHRSADVAQMGGGGSIASLARWQLEKREKGLLEESLGFLERRERAKPRLLQRVLGIKDEDEEDERDLGMSGSDDEACPKFVLSSGRSLVAGAKPKRQLTIDDEFEAYFSKLLL